MTRRQRLSATQIAELFDLPTERRELIRHYTLSPGDLAAIGRRRGDHNRLGHALMRCYLRYPGRPLRVGERPPAALLTFVADQITGRIGPGLAYAGASSTGAGFVMVATGLGLQHSALARAHQDPGRGMYAAGTTLGILGLCGIGTSYFFGLTQSGEDAHVIAFGAAIAAGTLLTAGSVFFFSDAARMRSVYRRLTTF